MYAAGSYSRSVGLYSEGSKRAMCLLDGANGGITHVWIRAVSNASACVDCCAARVSGYATFPRNVLLKVDSRHWLCAAQVFAGGQLFV
jgi:hypothetical protein